MTPNIPSAPITQAPIANGMVAVTPEIASALGDVAVGGVVALAVTRVFRTLGKAMGLVDYNKNPGQGRSL